MTTYEKLDPEFKAKWVAALRSGEYEQGKCALRIENKYCCLGVACIVAGYDDPRNVEDCSGRVRADTPEVPSLLWCTSEAALELANMNDGVRDDHESKSFAEIADWIEANL